jgi:uridine kinase
MANRPYLIGIAGPSCSGKTLLAGHLAKALPGAGNLIVSLDCYYRDQRHLSPETRAQCNYDLPESLDKDLLVRDIHALAQGHDVLRPEYDFASHSRGPGTVRLHPGDYVIVEGLFALYWEEVRVAFGTKVFIRLDDAMCFARRKLRDVQNRGRTEESVAAQYAGMVRPMYDRYCAPTQPHADITVQGDIAVECSAAAVLEHVLSHSRNPRP